MLAGIRAEAMCESPPNLILRIDRLTGRVDVSPTDDSLSVIYVHAPITSFKCPPRCAKSSTVFILAIVSTSISESVMYRRIKRILETT